LAQGGGPCCLTTVQRRTTAASIYATEMEAIDDGYHKFGNVPFLVKEIVAVEQPETFAASLIGL
jgi:hypothetical protein